MQTFVPWPTTLECRMSEKLAAPHPMDGPNRALRGGVGLVVIGLAAIAFDLLLSVVTVLAVGLAMVVGGAVGLLEVGTRPQERRRTEDVLSAAIPMALGAVLLISPVASLRVVYPVLLAFFVLDGVMLIRNAVTIRDGVWAAELATGVMTILLALPLALRAREPSLVLMATVIGLYLVGRGVMFIAASFVARKLVRHAS